MFFGVDQIFRQADFQGDQFWDAVCWNPMSTIFVRLIDDAFGIVWLWRTKLQVFSVKLT